MLIRQRKVSKQIRRCFKDVGVGSITNSYARGTHSRVRSKTVRKSGTSGTTWAAGGQPTAISPDCNIRIHTGRIQSEKKIQKYFHICSIRLCDTRRAATHTYTYI